MTGISRSTLLAGNLPGKPKVERHTGSLEPNLGWEMWDTMKKSTGSERLRTRLQVAVFAVPLVLQVLLPVFARGQEGPESRHEDDLPVATLVEVLELDLTEAPIARRVSSLVESPDGTVFVGGSTEVLVFDPDGAYRGEIGRQGDGPGEFRSLTGLGMHGDTLWAGDAMSGRVTRFLPDGSLLEIITPPPSVRGVPSFLTLAADGSVVGNPLSMMSPGASSSSRLTVWWRWDGAEGSDAGVADTLISLDIRNALMDIEARGRTLPLPQPFVEREFVAVAGTEPYALAAHALGEEDDGLIVVERLHFDGACDTAIAVQYRPRRITSEDIDGVVDRMGRVLSTPFDAPETAARPAPEIARQLRRTIDVPDYHPPLTDLVQGSGGSIWIGRESSASQRNWLIAQEGVGAVARITLADYQRPLSASDGYVWLLEPGAFDLPRIVKYRVDTP